MLVFEYFIKKKIFFLAKEHGKISSSSSLMSRLSYDCPAWIKSLFLAFLPAPMLNRWKYIFFSGAESNTLFLFTLPPARPRTECLVFSLASAYSLQACRGTEFFLHCKLPANLSTCFLGSKTIWKYSNKWDRNKLLYKRYTKEETSFWGAKGRICKRVNVVT